MSIPYRTQCALKRTVIVLLVLLVAGVCVALLLFLLPDMLQMVDNLIDILSES